MQVSGNSTQSLSQSTLDLINKATQNTRSTSGAGDATPGSSLSRAATLDQNEFLTLMLAQLKAQDPSKPVDSATFLGQLAQISQVQGLAQLNDSFSSLASSISSNQALQASSLLGRSALVSSGSALLGSSGGVTGAVDLPASSGRVAVNIFDASGALVQQINLGAQPQGLADFTWDGRLANGARAPAGTYSIGAQYAGGDGKAVSATTLINSTVQSVTMGSGNSRFTLELAGAGSVPFANVRRIS